MIFEILNFLTWILIFRVRFLNSLGPPGSILTHFHGFSMIIDPCRQLFNIFQKATRMGPWARPMGQVHGSGLLAQCWDPIFRANVVLQPRLCTKNRLPEFIPGFRGIPGFPGNNPNRAGLALGSARAGGKDDCSLHKLLPIIFFRFISLFFIFLFFIFSIQQVSASFSKFRFFKKSKNSKETLGEKKSSKFQQVSFYYFFLF